MCILTYDDMTLPGGYGHPVGLIEARNQSWKPQGPVGLFRVHWVSLVGAIPANNRWYQKSVELYAYLPMSGRHRPTDTFAGGDWHAVAGQNIAK